MQSVFLHHPAFNSSQNIQGVVETCKTIRRQQNTRLEVSYLNTSTYVLESLHLKYNAFDKKKHPLLFSYINLGKILTYLNKNFSKYSRENAYSICLEINHLVVKYSLLTEMYTGVMQENNGMHFCVNTL